MKGQTVLRIDTILFNIFLFITLSLVSLVSCAPHIIEDIKIAGGVSSSIENHENNEIPAAVSSRIDNLENNEIPLLISISEDVAIDDPHEVVEDEVLFRTSNNSSTSNVDHCSTSEFQCPSGECVHKSYQCNGVRDCKDGSDERDCPCKIYEFQCSSDKHCIHLNHVCNGYADCQDGSDEMSCSSNSVPTCFVDEFECSGGGCVPECLRCNGWNDCSDGSDEKNCEKCEPSGFRCPNGTCVRNSDECDELE
uniref:Very low-density lipoprotein receptor n=1 Tax=Cacopsylla melanoneura TaxID=428564 RepID=A0A8D8Y150_9HEMI